MTLIWSDYDYILVNRNLELCFKQLETIIKTNKTKYSNFSDIIQ